MPRRATLRVVEPSADEDLIDVSRRMLKYNFEDHIPDEILKEFQTTFNASSWNKDILTCTAPQRLMSAESGPAYHDAYVDLMFVCTQITTRAKRRP